MSRDLNLRDERAEGLGRHRNLLYALFFLEGFFERSSVKPCLSSLMDWEMLLVSPGSFLPPKRRRTIIRININSGVPMPNITLL